MQPHKGMHVTYFGDLCSAPPSVIRDVRWWIARLEELESK